MSIIRWQYGPADPEGPVPIVAQAIPQPLVPILGRRADAFLVGFSNPSTTPVIFSFLYLEIGQGETVAALASVISYRGRRVGCGMLVHMLTEGLLGLTYIRGIA